MNALRAWIAPAMLGLTATLFVTSLSGAVQASGGNPDSSDATRQPAPDAPEVRYDANLNGQIDSKELYGIISGFFAQHMSREDLNRLLLLHRNKDYVPPPSLLEMRNAAPWYQDGIGHSEEGYPDEVSAARALEEVARNCADQVARGISQWSWPFDEDMSLNESQILEYLGHLCQHQYRRVVPALSWPVMDCRWP